MKTAPHLHVVEGTGEVLECPNCIEAYDKAAKLERDMALLERTELRRLRRQIDQLKAKQHKDLRAHPRYALAFQLFCHWREQCDHPKAVFDDDRIKLVLARLDHFSEEALTEAIDGAAEDAYVDKKGKRHDGFDLIFRNAEKVESFRARAQGVSQTAAPTVRGVKVEGVVEAQLLVWGMQLLEDERTDQWRPSFDPATPTDIWGRCPCCQDPTLRVSYSARGRAHLSCRNRCDGQAIRIILQDEAQRAARRRGLAA